MGGSGILLIGWVGFAVAVRWGPRQKTQSSGTVNCARACDRASSRRVAGARRGPRARHYRYRDPADQPMAACSLHRHHIGRLLGIGARVRVQRALTRDVRAGNELCQSA